MRDKTVDLPILKQPLRHILFTSDDDEFNIEKIEKKIFLNKHGK